MPDLSYKENSEIAFSVGQILDKMVYLASVNPKTGITEYICIDNHSGGYWWWCEGPISRLTQPKTYKSVEEIGEDPFGSQSYLLDGGRIPYAVEVRCEIASRFEIKETVLMAKQKKLNELKAQQAEIQKEIDALQDK